MFRYTLLKQNHQGCWSLQSVNQNVRDEGLHGAVKDTQGNLQRTKNQQVDKDTPDAARRLHTAT